MTNLKDYIGAKLRSARQQVGLTQEQLAERIDKAVETISNIERGNTYTGLETLEKLSDALDKPVIYFLEDYDQSRTTPEERLDQELQLRELARALPDKDLDVAINQLRALADRTKR